VPETSCRQILPTRIVGIDSLSIVSTLIGAEGKEIAPQELKPQPIRPLVGAIRLLVLGKIERDGRVLYRFRAKEYRFYFEVKEGSVIVHRVLHKGTFSDFLFRSKMPLAEDEALANSKHFWKLIDEGRNAKPL
jgi:hypothetical protein